MSLCSLCNVIYVFDNALIWPEYSLRTLWILKGNYYLKQLGNFTL